MDKTFETKNAIFYKDKIVFRKSIFSKTRNTVVFKDEIKELLYLKPSLRNYFRFLQYHTIGVLYIMLSKPTFFRNMYGIRIDYNEVLKISSILKVKITIYK